MLEKISGEFAASKCWQCPGVFRIDEKPTFKLRNKRFRIRIMLFEKSFIRFPIIKHYVNRL